MDPFSFASSEALEIPLNVRMSGCNHVNLHVPWLIFSPQFKLGWRTNAAPILDADQTP